MTLVEGTNDYSIVSKLSAAAAGYFKDDFLDQMVDRKKKRASLINWGYYLRYKSLECSFEKLVSDLSLGTKPFQILSVGAGFDTTFFNVSSKYGDNGNFKFYEIDLPSNVQRKSKLIEKSDKCRNLLKNPKFSDSGIESDSFILFACDLAKQDELHKKLESCGIDYQLPTVILSECVITYMEEADSTNLIKFLAAKLHHAAFFVYEQIRPGDAFGQFMVAHFNKIGSPIKGVHKYHSPEEHEKRYFSCGWQSCSTVTLTNVFSNLHEEEKQRILRLEMFDEYEEFILKSSHYLVVCATKGSLGNFSLKKMTPSRYFEQPPEHEVHELKYPMFITNSDVYARFGHCVATFENKMYLMGGFGRSSSTDKRLEELVIYKMEKNGEKFLVKRILDSMYGRMFGSMAVDAKRRKLYVSGGRTVPNDKGGFKDILVIDVDTGEVTMSGWSMLGGPRWRHSSAVLGDHLVIMGGVTGDHNIVLPTVALNLVTGIWQTSEGLGLISGSAVVCEARNSILYSGGLCQKELVPTNKLHEIKVTEDNISVLTFFTCSSDNSLRYNFLPVFSHTSHVINNKLFVIGGVSLDDSPPCQILYLDSLEKKEVEMKLFRMPTRINITETNHLMMTHNHASVVLGKKLFIVGGGGNCFSFGTHYNSIMVKFDMIEKYML